MQPQVTTLDAHRISDGSEVDFGISFGDAAFRVPCRTGHDHILDQMRRNSTFYELDLLGALQAAIKPREGICLDIGANIGNHTLFFAGVTKRPTIAFEPVASNRAMLTRLVEINDGLKDMVTIVDCALSDAPGHLWMATPRPENPGMYCVSDRKLGGAEKVEAMTLDAYMKTNGLENAPIALIKVDVEGHEPQVLAGATETLARSDCVLSIEITSRVDFRRFLKTLAPFGFAPTDVFCATPTVLFAKSAGKKSDRLRILTRLKAHEQLGRPQ